MTLYGFGPGVITMVNNGLLGEKHREALDLLATLDPALRRVIMASAAEVLAETGDDIKAAVQLLLLVMTNKVG
jgi:hypothetical protein